MKVWLFVFDIDDTLYPEKDFVISGFQAVSDYAKDKLGVKRFFEAAMARFDAGERGKIFDHTLVDLGGNASPEIVAELVAVYRTHKPRISFYPGAESLIAQLKQLGHTAVISDGPVECQQSKARALGLSEWFEEIIFTEQLGKEFSKPHPRSFIALSEKFRVEADRSFYIADNPEKDFVAPNRLGWKTVHVIQPGQVRPLRKFPDPYRAGFQVRGFEGFYQTFKDLLSLP